MAIKFFAFFFPTISTFGCFWSQWPTSLAVTSGREGVRTTSFKPWRPHRGSCRGATAIEENNGSRREQWLTSLTVWTVHSIYDAVRAVAVAKRREYQIMTIGGVPPPIKPSKKGLICWGYDISAAGWAFKRSQQSFSRPSGMGVPSLKQA